MNILKKILEEKELAAIKDLVEENEKCLNQCEGACGSIKNGVCNCDDGILVQAIRKIQDYLSVVTDTNVGRKSGWIPVEKRLPEINTRVLAIVKHSSWISDFNSDWVPEDKKIHYPETQNTYIAYVNENNEWIFMDEEGNENICDKEFGIDMERVYDVVTHWQPLPASYKGEEAAG